MSADTNANIEDVVTVVGNIDSDAPVAMEIEDKLTQITTADPQQAHELVSDALDLGVLEEDETRQGFGGIRLVDADADVSDSDDSTGEDAGSVDANPRGETDKGVSGKAALDDAISWFHAQLDEEIYDHTDEANEDVDGAEDHSDRANTAREWFLENRGFKPETIEDKRLGWAPPHCTDALLAYLHRQGHSREEILASGVFTFPGDDEDGEKQNPDGNPSVSFSGRYIFPYFDETGTAAYAISRCTGSVGGRDYDGHPTDFHSGKYSKLAHTKDYVNVEEPIYGIQSLENDGPVIITEGVSDAIRAHEHGYACLSPVTTQFKKEHREQLADILRNTGRRTFIVQDAERPVVEYTDEADGWECLGIEQFGEGLKGAARTSAFLAEEGIDAYLAELPRIGVDKIDLDDYLGTWGDTLAPVLAGAKPGQEHPAYEQNTVGHLNNADANAYADANTHVDVDINGGGDASHTYAGDYDTLTKAEITDALEHVSSTLSYDEWIQMGYAVHSWDPGKEGKQVFTQWSRQSPKWEATESQNAVDWIWSNANPQRTAGHTTVGTLIAYAKQGGWEPPSRSLEPTTGIPLEMLASLDLDDARRFASKHNIEWATTREARERLRDEVFEVMQHGDTKVIDAPTALGKSYTVATEPWIRRESTTGGAPVVHTHETKKARDQAAAESADAGYDYAVLEGRTEACPVAAGEHDPLGREGTVDDFDTEDLPETVITIDGTPASDYFDTACEDRGLPFSVAHKYLENNKDQDVDLPCCAGDDNNECPAVTQWDGLPRTESGEPAVDVIHCTHQFAYVPSLRNGTNLIFDERPDFREDLSHRQVREAISAYLTVSGAPVTTFEEFVTRALNGDEKRNEHAQHATLRDAFGYEPEREWYLETEGAHTLAPALTRAVYYALKPDEDADDEHDAQDANGRYSATVPHEPPRLDANASDESGWNRTYVSVTLDANNTVRTVRNSPSLNGARSVIGLDAHPAQTQWELNVHPDIQTSAVLDPAERAMWRRFERGLLTVGVGDATRPFTSGEYFDREGSEAFFAALRDRFGEDFRTAITAASVESETKDILRDVGVEDPETMHYGEEKSRNDFAGEDVGALNGCIDPGDDFVLDLLAERGLDATPETTENEDGNEVRAHGRGFVGPDADAANELLASVRDQHIAQGAGRLARNADDPEDRAIVFVRTDAAPPGFLDMQVPGVEWLATDCQTDIIDELRQRSSATTRDIAESVGCSKEHARDTLRRLYDRGIVDVHENAGDHGAHLYRVLAGMDGPTNTNTRPGEHVDLSPSRGDDDDADGTANDAVCSNNTWALAISSVTPSGSVMSTGSTPDAPADLSQSSDAGAVDTGEPPG